MHVALIVPASNTVMEPDFHRVLGAAATVSTWRIHLESVTREAEERMLSEELPRCLDQLEPTHPDAVVFGCTSAGALGGLEHDARLKDSIEEAVGAPVVTVVGSMVSELAAVSPDRVAVFTPYIEDLTRSVAGCVEAAGYQVVQATGAGILENRKIGAMTPDEIADFVSEHAPDADVDAVFLSCTNWRAIEAVGPLSERLGLPVLSSNQVTLAGVQRLIDA